MTATTTTCAPPMIVPPPAAPKTLEQTGLSVDLLVQLVLKTLHFAGELTGSALGERLGLHYNAIQPAVDLLKSVRQIEIVGGSLLGGASFKYRITDSGRTRAALFLEQNRYVGAGARPAGAVPGVHARVHPRGAARGDARARPPGVLSPGRQRSDPRPARPGHQRRPVAVHLRPCRQRQDGDGPGDPQSARR